MAELLEIADELYALPLADFTPARDGRAKELKAEDAALAARVKALRKPTLAAWVVNVFVRRAPDQIGQVIDVGAALREAQASLDGDELRALTRQRRQLTAAVTTQARQIAGEEGIRVTSAVADQVEATLTAAMLDAEAAGAVRSGLLLTSLAPSGVGSVDLSGAVAIDDHGAVTATPRTSSGTSSRAGSSSTPHPHRPELTVVPDPEAEAKARRAAEEALKAAEETLAEAETDRTNAAEAVERHRAEGLRLQAEIDELQRRLSKLEADVEEVDDEVAEAEALLADQDARCEKARTARDRAASALDRA